MCRALRAVAAANPYAWFRDARERRRARRPSRPTNRMVAFPYPKFMNAILDVNQGAALLARERGGGAAARHSARRAGCTRGPASTSTEQWFLQDRARLHATARRCGAPARALLEAAGVSLGDDPAPRPLQLLPDRAAAVAPRCSASRRRPAPAHAHRRRCRGSAGPGNNYATHAIATLMDRLRAEPRGLRRSCTRSAGSSPSTALGVYARHAAAARLAARGRAGAAARGSTRCRIRRWSRSRRARRRSRRTPSSTAATARPSAASSIGRLDDGGASSPTLPTDRDVLESFETSEGVGRSGRLTCTGGENRFDPS